MIVFEKAWLPWVFMTFPFCKSIILPLLLSAASAAYALGLGTVSGQPILGQALHLEIPLIGSEDGVPAVDCFKVRPPTAEIESAFVLRNAQVQISGERGRARLIVTTAVPVREPVVEFGLVIRCGFEISKDYLLLAAEPSKFPLPTEVNTPRVTATAEARPSEPTQTTASRGTPAAASESLRLGRATTLAQLAQQEYPLQPKAREKFMRMMMKVNPSLAQEDTLVAAETVLQRPPGLPQRRNGPYQPQPNSAAAKKPAAEPGSALPTQPIQPPRDQVKPRQDILVLGAPGQRSATELLAEAERLAAILMEQTSAQSATVEKISQLETTLGSLKKQVIGLENRISKIELERQAEKLETKPVSVDFIELLLAVAAGGAIGGLALHFYNRARARRAIERMEARSDVAQKENFHGSVAQAAMPDKPVQREGLPWQKGYQPSARQGPESPSPTPVAAEKPDFLSPGAGGLEPAKSPSPPQNDFDFVSKP